MAYDENFLVGMQIITSDEISQSFSAKKPGSKIKNYEFMIDGCLVGVISY
jgi:hypothetical protein